VKKYGKAVQATGDNIIRCMRLACWIFKATDAHSEYVTHCFYMTKIVTRTRLSFTLCVHCLFCSISFFLINFGTRQFSINLYQGELLECA